MDGAGVTIIAFAVFMFGMLIGHRATESAARVDAIKANCGYYEASTGEFRFGRQEK